MDKIDIITIILGSSVITSIVTFFLHRKTERITAAVKLDFDNLKERLLTDLKWKQEACETMGKIYFLLYRSKIAFQRYARINEVNRFLEVEIIKDSNERVRDLILDKGYLIHPDLTDEANEVVEHYDVWLEKYDRLRVQDNSTILQIYVGPDGYKFPSKTEIKFREYYLKLWRELYSSENNR